MIATVSATALVLHAQPSAGSNRVLSPTTVAYWQQHDNGDGTGSLDLLVLWRGSPGWFFRGGVSSGGSSLRGGFGQWQNTHWMTYGDLTLRLDFKSTSKDFEPPTTVVTVLDREISLRDTNIVLIDGTDSGTPIIVGSQYVEPRFSGTDGVAAIVKRTPALFEFLQCDVMLPDANSNDDGLGVRTAATVMIIDLITNPAIGGQFVAHKSIKAEKRRSSSNQDDSATSVAFSVPPWWFFVLSNQCTGILRLLSTTSESPAPRQASVMKRSCSVVAQRLGVGWRGQVRRARPSGLP